MIRDTYISGVQTGIRIRSRDTSIRGVTFAGHMTECVQASQGCGLRISDCDYQRNDWPHKTGSRFASGSAGLLQTFLNLGSTNSASDWYWSAPTSIKGVTADFMERSLIRIVGGSDVANLHVSDVDVVTTSDQFVTIESTNHPGTRDIVASTIDFPSIRITNYGGAPATARFGSGLRLGNVEAVPLDSSIPTATYQRDAPVRVGSGTYVVRIPPGGLAIIADAAQPGAPLVDVAVAGHNAAHSGRFIIESGSATMHSFANATGSMGANIEAFATIPGTSSGAANNIVLHLSSAGALYARNRHPSVARSLTITLN